MPKTADPKLKEGKVYISQKAASEKWEEKNPQEKLILRMPKGKRDMITQYVKDMAEKNPDDRKYSTDKGRYSVNAYINTLIDNDMKINK